MTQSMKFQHGNNNIDVTEMFDDKSVRIQFWNSAANPSGFIDFNEGQLLELRKWVTVQIRKMKSKPSNKK